MPTTLSRQKGKRLNVHGELMLCAFWSPQCWWETNAKENSLVVRRAVGGRGVGSARDFTFMVGLLMCALTLSRDEVLLKRGLETWEKARQKAATGCDEIRTMRAGRGLEEVAAPFSGDGDGGVVSIAGLDRC